MDAPELLERGDVTEAEPERRRYSIACDFDGVLHSYTSPWVSNEHIPDPPVPGAIDWLNEISHEYDVIVHSTRAATEPGRAAIEAYLLAHGFEGRLAGITHEKPPCLLYLDDRAYRFVGRFPTAKTIRYAKPWKVGDPERPSARDKIQKAGKALNDLQNRQSRLKRELRGERELSAALHAALHHEMGPVEEWHPKGCDFCGSEGKPTV